MPHLFHDVQFAKPPLARRGVADRVQLRRVVLVHILHVAQPVVGEAHLVAVQRRVHAAAAVVAADDDVAHAQQVDRELQHRQAVQVGVHDEVGDVAVHEHFARREAGDLVGRHPAVRAADPEELGRLLVREAAEEFRVGGPHVLRPGTVALE